jgi:hypothetical protein
MAIILFESFLERSWTDKRVADAGGSSKGEFTDLHRASKNDVC